MNIDNDTKHKAIENLYREMFFKLNIYATNQLNSKSLAEEAVQETFKIAWTKIDQLLDSPNPNGWIMNTLKFVISNIKRDIMQANKILLNDFEFNENNMGAVKDEIDPMILYRGKLTEQEMILLRKYAIEKCSLLEISKELGISINACKKRVQRIKEKFKKNFSHF